MNHDLLKLLLFGLLSTVQASAATLVFNYLLTLAFARATPEAAVQPNAHPNSARQFASF